MTTIKTTGLNFGEALETAKNGMKIRRPDFVDGVYWYWDGKEMKTHDNNDKFNGGWFSAFPARHVYAEDWEIIEDLPKVKIYRSNDTYYECPKCHKTDEIIVYSEDIKNKGTLRECRFCGQKFNIINSDEFYNKEPNEEVKPIPNLKGAEHFLKLLHNYGPTTCTIKYREEPKIDYSKFWQIDSKEPIKLSLPSLKIDTTLNLRDIYIRSIIDPTNTDYIFGKLKKEPIKLSLPSLNIDPLFNKDEFRLADWRFSMYEPSWIELINIHRMEEKTKIEEKEVILNKNVPCPKCKKTLKLEIHNGKTECTECGVKVNLLDIGEVFDFEKHSKAVISKYKKWLIYNIEAGKEIITRSPDMPCLGNIEVYRIRHDLYKICLKCLENLEGKE
jgi:transcription elongation factor Elf1